MRIVGRNEPCPCGSGKKFKNCHLDEQAHKQSRNLSWLYLFLFVVLIVVAGISIYINNQQ